jgi:PTS system nitrogen regulatory IIA component
VAPGGLGTREFIKIMIKISKYLDAKLVASFDAKTRDEALNALIEKADAAGKLKNKQVFLDAIMDREKIVSTGIGMGVAIPHAKLADYDDFFIVIGILQKGVDWAALDHAPVRLIFMIGGPDDKQTEYLQILSSLTVAIKDEERRKKILTLNSADGIISQFKAF